MAGSWEINIFNFPDLINDAIALVFAVSLIIAISRDKITENMVRSDRNNS